MVGLIRRCAVVGAGRKAWRSTRCVIVWGGERYSALLAKREGGEKSEWRRGWFFF